MFTSAFSHRQTALAPPVSKRALGGLIVLAAVGASTTAALAQSFMSCSKVEADCEVQANQMQDLIAKSTTSGPYDYVFTVANCQSWLATAEQTSQWPATDNGQPTFPCSP